MSLVEFMSKAVNKSNAIPKDTSAVTTPILAGPPAAGFTVDAASSGAAVVDVVPVVDPSAALSTGADASSSWTADFLNSDWLNVSSWSLSTQSVTRHLPSAATTLEFLEAHQKEIAVGAAAVAVGAFAIKFGFDTYRARQARRLEQEAAEKITIEPESLANIEASLDGYEHSAFNRFNAGKEEDNRLDAEIDSEVFTAAKDELKELLNKDKLEAPLTRDVVNKLKAKTPVQDKDLKEAFHLFMKSKLELNAQANKVKPSIK